MKICPKCGYERTQKDDTFVSVGECPKCGYEEANGDQCEKCTSLLDPSQLKNPRSTVSGGKLEIKEVVCS